MSSQRARTSILDKPLSRGKGEVSLSCFALLFSEVVQYSQSRVYTVPELQNRWPTFLSRRRQSVNTKSQTHTITGCTNWAWTSVLVSSICILCANRTRSVKLNWSTCCCSWRRHCGNVCSARRPRNWSTPTTTIARITSSKRNRWSTNSLAYRKTKDHSIVLRSPPV